tara:strand:+ start:25 stop:693 length:669 start_codon:yes stop_codon:yes gene_type:complete
VRTELDQLRQAGYMFEDPFDVIHMFERKICAYTNAPMCVVVDSDTHALELCLRYYLEQGIDMKMTCPKHTYVSVPMTLYNLNIKFDWTDEDWSGIYQLGDTALLDAATRFTAGMYLDNYDMCLSFQWQKQLKIGKGGAVLTDNTDLYEWLLSSRHDGRDYNLWNKWTAQPVFRRTGYHYNMIPEDCALGILLMDQLPENNGDVCSPAKSYYPDLSKRLKFLN